MASTTDTASAYDLLILVDATASMSSYILSLRTSLPQIISVSLLTNCFSRVGLLAYRDYWKAGPELLEWSGWFDQKSNEQNGNVPDLTGMAQSLRADCASCGNDWPEALKTGLAKAYEVMSMDVTTLILLYADAPPHTAANRDFTQGSEWLHERRALSETSSFGGWGPCFVDWVSACRHVSGREGNKKAQVISILPKHASWDTTGYFYFLCTLSKGACLVLEEVTPFNISQTTMEVLLSWMGAQKGEGETRNVALKAKMARYMFINDILSVKDETDDLAWPYFQTPGQLCDSDNKARVALTLEVLRKHLPKKRTPIQDLSKRYASDGAYKSMAIKQFKTIIEQDVTAISLNPVFGNLWRTICNDRTLDSRQELLSAFGLAVEEIQDLDEKSRMKAWLEESYDYTSEVLDIIESVPYSQRFPCVFLDPTLTFTTDDSASDDDIGMPVTSFRRDELLEISRSCDCKILRRLGRVLTRFTYVQSSDDLPIHIAATIDKDVPKIPMALASKEHGFQFWKILLHAVVPGTMMSGRPAALLAALSLRMGIQPLREIAEREMLGWRDKWSDLNTPQTWNVNCLSLLLDADVTYRSRDEEGGRPAGLLEDEDRLLFERLVDYKLLELNLDTALTAKVGWTPDKSNLPIGPIAICVDCQYPRSVTIMGPGRKCGHCLWAGYESPEDRDEWVRARVSKSDDESSQATWVECNVPTCRSQYVVYRSEKLRVRPKCHYCRADGKLPLSERNNAAPWIECRKCLNRMIYPFEYRPPAFDKACFECVACSSGKPTIVGVETTARKLSEENTNAWLINDESKIKELFGNRSVYHTISRTGIKDFNSVQLFPSFAEPLQIKGKLVRDAHQLIAELKSWISRRRIQQATCSLCFSSSRKTNLLPACGRRGCTQQIDTPCLRNWYGINAPGQIINTAALHCPFCRRAPKAQTLAKYGMGVHALGNLGTAVQESGQWYHAWCLSCGNAKRYVERVCAGGGPPELRGWRCEDCVEAVFDEKGEVVGEMMKKCPGCGVETQRVGGCGHINCPVGGCGVHWCWFCGEQFSESAIYRHMSQVHGGFFGPEEEFDADGGEGY